MRRPLLVVLTLFIAVLGASQTAGQSQNCRDCQPSTFGASNPSGTYRIGFEPGQFSSAEQNGLMNGAQYWNGQTGPDVHSSTASYNDADIAFFVDYDLQGTTITAQAYFGSDGRGMIGVNPDRLGDARNFNYWSWVGGHEIGHMFDFQDVNVSGCGGMTVMFNHIPTNPQQLPSSMCSDDAASADKFGMPPGGSYCDFGCPPGYTTSCVGDQQPDPAQCDCCINYTPILIDLRGDGVRMTGTRNGVVFPINTCGSVLRMGWPDAADDVWLGLDRNRNGRIDNGSELFGNSTPMSGGGFAANGYLSLADWDRNRDDWIDDDDAVFGRLVLWTDANRNGVSESWELSTLSERGVLAVGVRYRRTPFRDRWGNEFRFAGTVRTKAGLRFSVDVVPVTARVTEP